jgi:hypothetical protein
MGVLWALLLAAAPPWPSTASELQSESPMADARVEDSAPCKGKAQIELRLFTRQQHGPQLRLTAKNCTAKTLKLLHDSQLQPSRLDFKTKVKAPFDERSREKYDTTIWARSFTALDPGQERVLVDETLRREGEAYNLSWGPFRYEAIPLGKQKVRVVLDAWVDSAVDEETNQKVKVDNAAVGSFKSNEVTVALP